MALTVTPTDEMKTLKVGEKIYEIVDDEARTDLNDVKTDLLKLPTFPDLYKAFPTDSASGPVASFSDGADNLPMPSVKAKIEPIQDLHGYDSPWPAGGGKNLLKTSGLVQGTPSDTAFSNVAKRTFTADTFVTGLTSNNYYMDGRVSQVSVAENALSVTSSARAYALAIPVIGLIVGSVYVVSAVKTNGSIAASFYKEDGTFISNTIANANNFTVPAETYYTLIHFSPSNDGEQATYTNIQLELGSTATSYAPYSNICPISGWDAVKAEHTGKNLLNLLESEMYSYGYNRYFPFKIKAGTYTMSCQNKMYISGELKGAKIIVVDANRKSIKDISTTYGYGNGIMSFSFTITEEESRAIEWISFAPTANGITFAEIAAMNNMVELGSNATDYEPYTGESITIDLGQTVYGGTLDVVSGELVIDRAMVTATEDDEINYASNSDGFLFYCSNKSTGAKSNGIQICDRLRRVIGGSASALYSAESGFTCYPNSTLYFKVNTSIATVTDMKAYLSSVGALQFCYELATPLTVSLTPHEIRSLLGANNVWADSGDSAVIYRADPNLYIQKKITEAVAALS